MKQIEFINYPYVFTDTGERIDIKELKGFVRVGASIDEYGNIVNTSDSECVGGACPIK